MEDHDTRADGLRTERDGATLVVSLARPAKKNCLDDALVLGLSGLFAALPTDVGAVVLRGDGGNFCAGLDLNEVREADVHDGLHTSVIGQRLNDLVAACPVPVIAVLHGAVIGAGLELAAAAHLRIAEGTAFYALPEGVRGIFLGSGGSVRLPRLLGLDVVTDMMLTGRTYGAEEGHRLRFSQYLVGDGEGLALAKSLAQKVAGNAPLANHAILRALPLIAEQDIAGGLLTERLMTTLAQLDDEAKRRLRDFLDRKLNKVEHRPGSTE